MGVHHKLRVVETVIIQITLDVDIVCSAWQHAAELKARLWKLRSKVNIRNLQNIPSSSKYAKIIKQCFEPDKSWLFIGSDFSSLEDKINALITKDPNKIKVYVDGYDGHSLRTYAYFSEEMPDINPDSVESINSIQTLYKEARQKSKAPTFALT